jgi:RNA polymerase sigma-70 factor (ECF subfamily)
MNSRFATTHWSLVLAAGKGASADAQEALANLCQTYWYPLYAYVRRQGHQPDDAQDLTQAFFARLLEQHYLQSADPERGRFRSFLLTNTCHSFRADDGSPSSRR